jgi:glycosyltransferase involved in cell wall biosynthesis
MIVSNDVVHDSRVLKEGRALKKAGHEVVLLGWDRSGRLPANDVWEGIPIMRVRTEGWMRVMPNDILRNPMAWRRLYHLARSVAFDAIHCHDLDTLPVGVRLKKRTRRPLVYDCHEVFGYMIEEDVPPFVTKYAFRLERRLGPQADRVIAVNESVKAYIDSVTGRDSVLVRNCPELVLNEYRPPPPPPFRLVYIGTLHRSRFVLESIETVAETPEVSLTVGGSKALTPVVQEMCARQPNTHFVGLVPNDEVLPMTVNSHAVLSMFDPTRRINQVGLPNKIFEAMAAGRPSIVTEGLPMSDLVLRERCGLVVPYTKAGLRSAIERLRAEPALAESLGRSGLEAAKQRYNWTLESQKLIALYSELRS